MATKKIPLFYLILLTTLASLGAYEGGSRDIFFKIAGARTSEPPTIMEDKLILLYKPEEPTRFVGAAFAHENFTQPHPFKINDYGVFFLVYPLPESQRELTYRLIVDGLWIPDPANTRRSRDTNGITLSKFSLPERPAEGMKSPRIGSNRMVTFSLRASRNQQVFLAGSFNHWDPYMYKMKESSSIPGLYEITLPMRRGTYYYNFLYNGVPITDPENLELAVDQNKREVSIVQVP